MNKEILLKAGYERYNQPEGEPTLYQKKVKDKSGIKYFINCYHYTRFKMDSWGFKLQVETKIGTININLFGTDLNIKEIEKFMEKTWKSYESIYYEKFDLQENDGGEE